MSFEYLVSIYLQSSPGEDFSAPKLVWFMFMLSNTLLQAGLSHSNWEWTSILSIATSNAEGGKMLSILRHFIIYILKVLITAKSPLSLCSIEPGNNYLNLLSTGLLFYSSGFQNCGKHLPRLKSCICAGPTPTTPDNVPPRVFNSVLAKGQSHGSIQMAVPSIILDWYVGLQEPLFSSLVTKSSILLSFSEMAIICIFEFFVSFQQSSGYRGKRHR